ASGGQARGPRRRGSTRYGDHVTTPVLVALGLRPRKLMDPERRAIGEICRMDRLQDGRWNSDVGNFNNSAVEASGQQQMSRLSAEESNSVVRFDRRAHHRTGRAVHAA